MTKKEELEAALKGDGCLGRSAEDEPVFVICGRDPVAGRILREWADHREILAVRTGQLTDREKLKIAGARREALQMDQWRRELLAAQAKAADPDTTDREYQVGDAKDSTR